MSDNPYRRWRPMNNNPHEQAVANAPGLSLAHLDRVFREGYVDAVASREEKMRDRAAAAWDEGSAAGYEAGFAEAKKWTRTNILPYHRAEQLLDLIATVRERAKTKRDGDALRRLNNLVSNMADTLDGWER